MSSSSTNTNPTTSAGSIGSPNTTMKSHPPNQNSNSNNNNSNHTTTTISLEAQQRLVYGKDDALFGYIEKQQQSATTILSESNSSTGSTHPKEGTASSSSSSLPHFGHVLDAGTGLHSLRWLASLATAQPPLQRLHSVTAITADRTMQRHCQQEVDALGMTHMTSILYGNWFPATMTTSPSSTTIDPPVATASTNEASTPTIVQQLQSQSYNTTTTTQQQQQQFNVILADYLIGAMDGFVPYQQDFMIPQLISLLAPKGRLYIVGLQPIPDSVPTTTLTEEEDLNHTKVMNLMCRVRQVRDACILLAGHRCYREYPMEWILRQVDIYNNNNNNNPKVRLVHSKQFPILYRHTTILKQINVGRSKIPLLPVALRESMQQVWNDLEEESQRYTKEIPNGRVPFGFDYVVCIERTE